MITREQVEDLREGDVVELRDARMPDALLRGRVDEVEPDVLGFGIPTLTILRRGELIGNEHHTLTVVSRARRPLYVNHPRPEPVHKDVVLDGDGDLWQRRSGGWLLVGGSGTYVVDISDCAPLRLLVDGETGQVVP